VGKQLKASMPAFLERKSRTSGKRCLQNLFPRFHSENQIQDAAGSMMHNIAERFDSGQDAENCKKDINAFITYLSRSAH
jgi:hypothetical protein